MKALTAATPHFSSLEFFLLKLVTFFLSKDASPFIRRVSYLLPCRSSLVYCMSPVSLLLYCLRSRRLSEIIPRFFRTQTIFTKSFNTSTSPYTTR